MLYSSQGGARVQQPLRPSRRHDRAGQPLSGSRNTSSGESGVSSCDRTAGRAEGHMLKGNGGTVAAVERIASSTALLVAAALCAAAGPAARAAASAADEAAVWVQREVNFRYVGFTTKYSCDGLRDRMRRI